MAIEPISNEGLRLCAKEIVESMWKAFGPEVEDLFFQKLIQVAGEKWRFRWEHEEEISVAISKEVSQLLETTFKPALDEIALKKARKKVQERAAKSSIEIPQELLFPNGGE